MHDDGHHPRTFVDCSWARTTWAWKWWALDQVDAATASRSGSIPEIEWYYFIVGAADAKIAKSSRLGKVVDRLAVLLHEQARLKALREDTLAELNAIYPWLNKDEDKRALKLIRDKQKLDNEFLRTGEAPGMCYGPGERDHWQKVAIERLREEAKNFGIEDVQWTKGLTL
jgi:hypothetical protein